MKTAEMKPEHYTAVKQIYSEGISTGQATFQTDTPSWEDWDKAHLNHSRIISLDENGNINGWAALTPVSGRCVYAGVAEVSVYVGEKYRGKGYGSILLKELILRSEQNGIWTLQAGIFPENIPSIQLHKNNGFRIIGTRERIGQMNGKWRDTVLLERRSNSVGI
jgi:L-amino acid N-acyltransferase YncA